MPAIAIVGAQWGDEGKGKVTDIIGADVDAVVRAQGGANAGHTVVVGDRKYKLHLMPSGILREGCVAVVGPGCVVDPDQFMSEVKGLAESGDLNARLILSDRAHVVLPHHKALDAASEKSKTAVGSTMRGIGYAYAGKAARANLRVADIMGGDTAGMLDRVEAALGTWLTGMGEAIPSRSDLESTIKGWRGSLAPYVDDSTSILHEMLEEDQRILLEGAQGVLLDIDHGTYPYVTSSGPSTAGLCAGSGVAPTEVESVLGIVKAYTTRVGMGPFPSELDGAVADQLVQQGAEFGTTTGRRRRVGWLDLVALQYAARLNGFTHLSVMKLDVLDGVDDVQVCVAYDIDGTQTTRFPARSDVLERVVPVYEAIEGTFDGVASAKSVDDLPAGAKALLDRMMDVTDAEIAIASVGPARSQTIVAGELP